MRNQGVAYLRVSTMDQDFERQRTEILEYSNAKGFEIVKFFQEKSSGSKNRTFEREEFVRMESFIDNNIHVKDVFVMEVSRLGRRNTDVGLAIERFKEKRICIHMRDLKISTLDENYETVFANDLLISFLSIIAENETRQLKQRIKSGKAERINQGLSFNAKLTGYKKDYEGRPIVDESKAYLVRKVFELASKGIGMRSISDIIMGEFKVNLQMGTIGGIIKNVFYKGDERVKIEIY